MAVWAVTVATTQPKFYNLSYFCYVRGVDLDSTNQLCPTEHKKAKWVAGCAALSLHKEGQSITWVLFPVSQPWFYSSDLLHVAYS